LRPNFLKKFNAICRVKRRVSVPELHMPNRTAKFASAVFASVLAGVSFTVVSSNIAHAEDSCLSAPNKGAASGHWYYHLDHATKRHCWYLRDGKQARATPQDVAAPTDATSSQNETPSPQLDAGARPSIANAHAELPPPRAPAQPRTNTVIDAPTAAPGVNPAAQADALPAPAPDTSAAPSVVGSRWLDPASTASSSGSPQLASASDTTSPSNPSPAADSNPSPAAAAVPLAAADASSAASSNPLQTMLLIVIGALAFAGLAGSIIFRFGRTRVRSHAMQGGRRDIWDAYDELPQRPALPAAAGRRPNIGIPQELRDVLRNAPRDEAHAAEEPDDRIAQMLAQLARTART
jgi:hypothetical protein